MNQRCVVCCAASNIWDSLQKLRPHFTAGLRYPSGCSATNPIHFIGCRCSMAKNGNCGHGSNWNTVFGAAVQECLAHLELISGPTWINIRVLPNSTTER